jgi:hypothetical protein
MILFWIYKHDDCINYGVSLVILQTSVKGVSATAETWANGENP